MLRPLTWLRLHTELQQGSLLYHLRYCTQELDKDVEKWFVSSGFAFVHPDSTADLCAVEAVKLTDLDPEAVKAGLADYSAKLGSLQVGLPSDLHSAFDMCMHSKPPNTLDPEPRCTSRMFCRIGWRRSKSSFTVCDCEWLTGIIGGVEREGRQVSVCMYATWLMSQSLILYLFAWYAGESRRLRNCSCTDRG